MTHPRYADVLAAARAEYAEWYKALGDRVAATAPAFRAGIHYRRRLPDDPWCRVCGRPTWAKGLCRTHYVSDWRKRQRRARGLRYVRGQTNTTCGHLDRKHQAHGRCKPCDHRWRRARERQTNQAAPALRQQRQPAATGA